MRAWIMALALAAALAGAASAASRGDACFRSSDYQGFRPVDAHAFIMRTDLDAFFRIEVEGSCPELTYPQATLVTVVRGSELICGPLDWDLRVGQLGPGGFVTGCIVRSQHRLTAAEVAALPPSLKP